MRAVLAFVAVALLTACNSTSSVSFSYVPWMPLPRGNANITLPSPTAPVPIPPGTPLCSAAQIEGRLLGTFNMNDFPNTPVLFRDRAPTPCYLNGAPDLTIVDAHGRVLATSDSEGTQFDAYIAPVDVLLQPGTAPLASASFTGTSDTLNLGQALLNIKWSGCSGSPAARLLIDLPGGGGRATVDFQVVPPDEKTCFYKPWSQLSRDPLKPTGIPWPPAVHRVSVQFTVDAPKTAKAGTTIEYFVTIRNLTTSDDYVLSPCPDYGEALVPGGPNTYYQLNCGPVGAIRTGKAVTFQMKFAIPSWTYKGPWQLQFGLIDGRQTPPGVQTPITII